jgi:hypothetical protein
MGRRTRFVFVLQSVYHCSDKLHQVTNRLHLPWKDRESARTTQISDALSLTTLLRRAALRPQTPDKTLQQASQGTRLNLPPSGGSSGRKRPAAIVRGVRTSRSALAATALHCLAAPAADVKDA